MIDPTNIKSVFMNMGKRFTFGGEAPKDQRVYFFNTKELMGNKYGTPNHLLVNKISDYDIRDFNIYCNKVIYYMLQRGYNVSKSTLDKLEEYTNFRLVGPHSLEYSTVFKNWHNKEYLRICMANLYEKHISQGESQITDEEWQKITDKYKKITKEEYKV